MVDTALLKDSIKMSGLKLSYIAEQLGLSRQGLANKLRGDRRFTVNEVYDLRRLLGLTAGQAERIFFARSVDK